MIEITELPRIRFSKEEERALIRKAHRGDLEARNRIVMSVSEAAFLFASKYATSSETIPDCYQYIMMVLSDKFYQFKLKFKTRFITWAYHWMKQAAIRWRQTDGHRGIRIPTHHQSESDRREVNPEFLIHSDRAAALLTFGQLQGTAPNDPPPELSVPDHREQNLVEDLSRLDRVQAVRDVMKLLTARELYVLQSRMNGRTLRELSVDMGISRERARQLEDVALRRVCRLLYARHDDVMGDVEEDSTPQRVLWARRFASGLKDKNRTAKRDWKRA